MSWIKAYKGFNKNLQCQPDDDKPPFQYEVGKEYEESEAKLCSYGFHACEFPLDVFGYYPPDDSRYCEVELDATEEKEKDSKRTGKKIKIGAEIGLNGIIKAGVKFILEKAESCDKGTGDQSVATNTGYRSVATNTGNQSVATNTGYRSVATNTGNQSAATNTGYRSVATNTGSQSVATNTGDWSAATNTGNQSAATNTGDWSAATNTGNQSAATNTGYRSVATNTGSQSVATNTGSQSVATNTGDWSAATNTGYQSVATNAGDWSAATVSGEESVACALGYEGKAKGTKGCWLVLAEWKDGHRKDVRCFYVDGESVKENVFYKMKEGALVEVD